MAGHVSRGRYWFRLIGLVLIEVAVFLVLLRAAPVTGSVDLSHLRSWLSDTAPSTALTGLIRSGGLVLSGWLVASTIVYGIAAGSGSANSRRRVARLTLAPLRRLIDSAAALSILVSAATTSAAVAGGALPASAAPASTSNAGAYSPGAGSGSGTGALRPSSNARPGAAPAAPALSVTVIGRHLPHPGLADHNEASLEPSRSVGPLDVSAAAGALGLAAGTKVYVVQPGDCLSVIAERHLGDWRRDQEIDALNRGRTQPDGRTLIDDHWIYPGWILVMPTDAVDTETVGAIAAPSGTAAAAAPSGGEPSSVTSGPPPASARESAPPVAAARPAPSQPAPSAPKPGLRSEHDHGALRDAEDAMTALAAGAFVWGLRRRRREAMHDRPSGRAIRRNRPAVEQADARARAGAREETVRWVDAGLRYLGRALLEREESTVPSVAMVRAAPDGMEVMISPPDLSPPRHFEAIEGGAIWVLDPTMGLDEIENLAGPCWPFLPALVSLGEAPGGTVLVNLEHAGTLSLEGDSARVAGLLAQMTLELRSQPWAEEMLASLDLVGLPFVAPEGQSDVATVIESATRTAGRYQAELAAAPSVAIRRAAACQWLPAVTLLGEAIPPPDRATLVGLARPDRSGVAVVGWGPIPEAPWRMSISPTGEATLSGLLHGHFFEMRLRVSADADQIALLEEALATPLGGDWTEGPDEVGAEPRGDGGLDVTGDGGLEPSGNGGLEQSEDEGLDPDLVVDADQLAELEDWMAGAAEWESEDWGEVAMDVGPAGSDELGGGVGSETADREGEDAVHRSLGFRSDAAEVIDLRVDVEEPGVSMVERSVELKVLGPVELVGGGGADSVPASRRASALAVVCYLATRTRPASADQIATALWPADTSKDNFGEPRRKTVMNVISRARLLLGESTVSSSRLLLTDRGYTLSEEVACDWTRFQTLVGERGGSPSEVAARLKEALELVGGEPFVGSLSRPFYEWVSAEHLDLAMTAQVVDAAESLGRLGLESEDHETAEWAVQKGLQLDPAREELFQVWMHIAGRGGRPDRVDEIYRRLCRALQRHIDAGLSPSDTSEAVRSAYCARPARV